MAQAGSKTGSRPFHMRRWLSIQQAVDHLSALSEEPLTSDDLARLAEDHQLDLYWYRPGQQLHYVDHPHTPTTELSQPLRLCPTIESDWQAIVGVLRQRPAFPAEENDTPLLRDADGNKMRITFDFNGRPEPFSGRWYPQYGELVVKRRDIERLEQRLFQSDEDSDLEPQLLLDVIWELEQLALENGNANDPSRHDLQWLAHTLSDRTQLEPAILDRVLHAAERRHQSHH
ncbi:hypothetical protein ACFQ2X_03775 [Microbulbifer celer]|uniref:Uncharacterized protein n=2 Tax=Microbulbifer celer TaxID=435905 RepID=A0ABW3U5N0_9GAMM